MSDWNLPPGVSVMDENINPSDSDDTFCTYEDCGQEAKYCCGHVVQFVAEAIDAKDKRIAELEVAIARYLSAASNSNLMGLSEALEKTQAKLQEKDDE